MRRILLVLFDCLALFVVAACTSTPTGGSASNTNDTNTSIGVSNGGASTPTSSPTPSPSATLSVAAACPAIYGPGAVVVTDKDMNGLGQTGWACRLANGKVVLFTLVDMQKACNAQFPGTLVTNLVGSFKDAASNNSQFKCVPATGYDNQNPGPSCGTNGHENNPIVVTVPGSTRTLKLPGGKVFGQLVLRHSTECQTAFGEVIYPKQKKPPGFQITIVVERPGAPKPRIIPFTTSDFISPAFSSMLGNNATDDGCVLAWAYVTAGGRNGATVTTNCSAS